MIMRVIVILRGIITLTQKGANSAFYFFVYLLADTRPIDSMIVVLNKDLVTHLRPLL